MHGFGVDRVLHGVQLVLCHRGAPVPKPAARTFLLDRRGYKDRNVGVTSELVTI
jgi:hypothetical protein